jgi:hypothetical protein
MNILAAALQQSHSRKLCALLTVVVFLIIFLVSPRTEIYNYYQQSSNTLRGTDGGLTKSNIPGLNRKYNLMDETDGLGKLKQLFNGFDSKECTAGYINILCVCKFKILLIDFIG